MNCAECESQHCCRTFSLFYTKDGKPVYLSLKDAGFPWDTMVIELDFFIMSAFLCVLQDVNGKCIIYDEKPKTCDNFRC